MEPDELVIHEFRHGTVIVQLVVSKGLIEHIEEGGAPVINGPVTFNAFRGVGAVPDAA